MEDTVFPSNQHKMHRNGRCTLDRLITRRCLTTQIERDEHPSFTWGEGFSHAQSLYRVMENILYPFEVNLF